MNYDLIVSDFDGTLAGRDRIVSPENKDAILRFIEAGGYFTIASGRSFDSICNIIRDLGLGNKALTLICLNGSVIREFPSGKLIEKTAIDRKELLTTARMCEEKGLYYHVYDADSLYVAEENDINKRYRDFTGTPYKVVGVLSDFIAKNNIAVTKLLIVTDKEKTLPMIDELNASIARNSVFFSSNPIFVEMCDKNAGKGNALKALAAAKHIDISRTIAIGDQYNDIPMIEAAGLSVAVGNAVDALKAKADYIAPPCSESAIADVINKFCLKETSQWKK